MVKKTTRKTSKLGGAAFILAIIAVGLSGYNFYNQYTSETSSLEHTSLDRVWYDYKDTFITETYPLNDPGTITDLSVIFDVREGESVYFSYMSSIQLERENAYTYVYFFFALNRTEIRDPATFVYFPQLDDDFAGIITWTWLPISLQYYSSTIEPGTYELTVEITSIRSGDPIIKNTLFVQAFKTG